jgi:hypothetical protein
MKGVILMKVLRKFNVIFKDEFKCDYFIDMITTYACETIKEFGFVSLGDILIFGYDLAMTDRKKANYSDFKYGWEVFNPRDIKVSVKKVKSFSKIKGFTFNYEIYFTGFKLLE